VVKVPKFSLYGDGDPKVEEVIQPSLGLRKWTDLSAEEKTIALRHIVNSGWLSGYSKEILESIKYLNREFLRVCPGKRLHRIKPEYGHYGRGDNSSQRMRAAFDDFQDIFVNAHSEELVLLMLSVFAERHVNQTYYGSAQEATDEKKRKELIEEAFQKFDRLANCLNHVFEQFSINAQVTRLGIVPKQDEIIIDEVYNPTLRILADRFC